MLLLMQLNDRRLAIACFQALLLSIIIGGLAIQSKCIEASLWQFRALTDSKVIEAEALTPFKSNWLS